MIKSLFAMLWAFSSSFLVYLIYIVMQTESDPSIRWAWITMSALTFAGASLLAYIVMSAKNDSPRAIYGETEDNEYPSTDSPTDENKTE